MRVILADDHALFRDGLVSLLETTGHEVVAQVGEGDRVLETVSQHEADLLLLDLKMPGKNGLDVLREIKQKYPDLKVVILTVSNKEEDVVMAIRHGADGYLLKDLTSQEFMQMLARLEEGEVAIPHKVTKHLVHSLRSGKEDIQAVVDSLTKKEMIVLTLMGEGLTNKEIAKRLVVSPNTVKYHVRNIIQKLNASNRTEAVSYALRYGIISSSEEE